jgi:hypothetical protein
MTKVSIEYIFCQQGKGALGMEMSAAYLEGPAAQENFRAMVSFSMVGLFSLSCCINQNGIGSTPVHYHNAPSGDD